jgi:hypothetical protein
VTPRIQADAVLDLEKWAKQPNTLHDTREATEAAAVEDARWLQGQVVYVRLSGCSLGDHAFDPPVRARVYSVDTDRWMDTTFLDPYVDFVFLDPVPDDVFEPDEEGKQYGWWFSRTHQLSTPTPTEE